jgi:hypothetical protein
MEVGLCVVVVVDPVELFGERAAARSQKEVAM